MIDATCLFYLLRNNAIDNKHHSMCNYLWDKGMSCLTSKHKIGCNKVWSSWLQLDLHYKLFHLCILQLPPFRVGIRLWPHYFVNEIHIVFSETYDVTLAIRYRHNRYLPTGADNSVIHWYRIECKKKKKRKYVSLDVILQSSKEMRALLF